uniref:PDZ domain-containing protein n=1 Tax=Rhabditophanes sp. KR3021 TaxID=114890 RepID=A0AC35U8S4_9BILA
MEEEISIHMTRSTTAIPWGVGFRQSGGDIIVDILDKGSIAEKAGLNRTDRLISFQNSTILPQNAQDITNNLNHMLSIDMKLKRLVSYPITGIPWALEEYGDAIQYNTFADGHNTFHNTSYNPCPGQIGHNNYQGNSCAAVANTAYSPRTTPYASNNSMYSSSSNYSDGGLRSGNVANSGAYNREQSFGNRSMDQQSRSAASSPYNGPRVPYYYNQRNYNNVSPDATLAHLYGNSYQQRNNENKDDFGHMIRYNTPQSDSFKRISKAIGTA